MNPASFLLIALIVGVIGAIAFNAYNKVGFRRSSAMEEFRREMQALAPKEPGSQTPTEANDKPVFRTSPTRAPTKQGRIRKPDSFGLGLSGPNVRDGSRLGGRFGDEPDSRSGDESDIW